MAILISILKTGSHRKGKRGGRETLNLRIFMMEPKLTQSLLIRELNMTYFCNLDFNIYNLHIIVYKFKENEEWGRRKLVHSSD